MSSTLLGGEIGMSSEVREAEDGASRTLTSEEPAAEGLVESSTLFVYRSNI